jgi:hypothetical protein
MSAGESQLPDLALYERLIDDGINRLEERAMSVLSDPIRFRKTIAGLALIGAPLAGFLSCLTDSSEGVGQSGAPLYATATADGGRIWVTGLIFMVSAILTVPAALGLAHLLRARGAVLGHLGAACLVIGAFGHMGYAVWQLMVSRVSGPGAPALVAYLDRTSALALVLVPLMVLVDAGLVLLAAGLLRARAVPRWAPRLVIVAVAADFAVQFTSVTATWPVTAVWGLLVVSFGSIGVRVLAMTPATWAAAGLVPSPAAGSVSAPVPA